MPFSPNGTLLHKIKQFVFPAFCLGCEEGLKDKNTLFCPACATLVDLIDPEERCSYCFEEEKNTVCSPCKQLVERGVKIASAFDYVGPMKPFIHAFKYGNRPYLAQVGALYLLAMLDRLNWPPFDFLIPIPLPFFRKWTRGYNQSALLANSLSLTLKTPVRELLKRKVATQTQTKRPKKERRKLTDEVFVLKHPKVIEGRRLLLIDDVVTTGSTLRAAAKRLLDGAPRSIHALTLVRTGGG